MVTQTPRPGPGDSAWRAWLEQTGQKTFRYAGESGTFSGRRETKAERSYWYAYRKTGGRLRKAYLGRTEDLTPERLDDVARQLAVGSQPTATVEPEPGSIETDLPKPTSPLIGRHDAVVALGRRLLSAGNRLLTLTGPGGTGKTRMAIAIAEDVRQHFADGVRFVDLSAIVDADLVVREIARHLGIQDVGELAVGERLLHYLANRHMLLVLDNMEQVVSAGPDLAALLVGCPRIHLLVTSREPLHVSAEDVQAVAPLDVPDLDAHLALEDLGQVAAVALFLVRAREAGANLDWSEQTGRDVAELCVRLDGLPLAIELAAARARLLRPRDIVTRITRQLELLRSQDDRPARHQSLRAVVGWSYELLTESEQRAFRCVSVFSGGCTLDAAEAIIDEPHALDLLASLIDKSLVRNEPGRAGESRLRILETIRAFGLEQMQGAGEADSVRARHANYYLALVRPPAWEALDLPTPDWLAMVTPELDNLRAALRWAFDSGARRVCLELATSLQGLWIVSGYLREGLHWMEQAVDLAEGLDQRVESWARHAMGQLAWRQGDYDRAARHYAVGLALREVLGDTLGVAIARQGLASVARDRGDVHESIVLWEQCVAVFREYGNRTRTLRATLNLAISLYLAGQTERAATLLEESIPHAIQVGQPWVHATALTYLALIALEVRGDRSRAATYVLAALPVAQPVADTWVTAQLLELAAWLAGGSDHSAGLAGRLFGGSDALRERTGARLHPAFRAGHERWTNAIWHVDGVQQAMAEGGTSSDEVLVQLALNAAREASRTRAQAADVAPLDTGRLSVREREIAGLVARGLTSREIAARLVVGERTVETHVDHIRAKLGVRSRAQIAAWAVERGLAMRDA